MESLSHPPFPSQNKPLHFSIQTDSLFIIYFLGWWSDKLGFCSPDMLKATEIEYFNY